MSSIIGGIDCPTSTESHLGPTVRVAGWAYALDGLVSSVRIDVNGRAKGAGICRYRPDVAEALGTANAAASGFEAEVEVFDKLADITAVAILVDGRQAVIAVVTIVVARPRKRFSVATPAIRSPALARARTRAEAEPIRLLIAARSLDRGGSQLRMAELVRHLGKQPRFLVQVLSPHEGPLRADLEACGARVEIGGQVCLGDVRAYEAGVASLVDWARGRFDIVFGFTMTSFPAVEAAGRLGLPSVLRVGENEPIATVARWMGNDICDEVEERYRSAMSTASVVVSFSQMALDTQRALGVRGWFTRISNGVPVPDEPISQARRLQARAALGLPPGQRLLICPGSIWMVKGQSLLAEAFGLVAHKYPDVDLVLIGQWGPQAYLDGIRSSAKRWGFTDRLRIEPMALDIIPWLSASDIAVCASESESLPTAVLEAMAIGLPTVSTSIGDLPLVITDGTTGWLSPPSDLAGLSRALDRALSTDSDKLAAMGRLGQERVRAQYEQGDSLRRLTDLLATLSVGRFPRGLSFC